MKNRSRMDIVAAVLETSKDGARKTQIMYTALLPFAQAQEYLKLLIDRGMLDYDGKIYHTTADGTKFLKTYKEMRGMFGQSYSSLTCWAGDDTAARVEARVTRPKRISKDKSVIH